MNARSSRISRRSAVEYMSMLRQSYLLIKEKSPNTIVVSAGLSPTGTNDGTAVPDDVYLEWLYDNVPVGTPVYIY